MSTGLTLSKRASAGALALAVCLTGGAVALSPSAHAGSSFAFGAPISGANRIDTAVAAAEAGFPSGASSVVVVNGRATVDGLTATYIAGLHNAPILYTNATSTPDETNAEIAKLGAKSVYVVGGVNAVSQSQLDAWTSHGMGVTAYGGTNRYATAAAVADAGGKGTVAFVASGDDAHVADALAVGGIAYQKHFPILLTRADSVPAETTAELAALHSTPIVVGGTTGVSDATMASLGSSKRLGGTNRSQTAAMVADWSIGNAGFAKTSVALVGADNANAADALVAAPIAGMNGVPMLFAGTADTNAYLATNASNYTGRGFVFGGPTAISTSAITAATSAANGAPTNYPTAIIPTSLLTSLVDNGTAGTIDSGDVIRIKFSTAMMAPAAGANVQFTDTNGTPTVDTLVNGTNATFALNGSTIADGSAFNGSAPGTVLTITVTGAPTVITAGSIAGLQTLARVTDASGVYSSTGGRWSVMESLVGTAPTAAVQTLTVPTTATGGTFSITGSATTVSGIAYNASTSTLAGNIATAYGLSNAGLVTVTGPVSGVYTVTFASSVGPVATMTTTSSLTAPIPQTSAAVTTTGVTAVADVQTISFSGGTPTAGAWTLTGSAGTSGSLAYNATQAAVTTAAIAATGISGASASGSMASGFTVTFPSSAGPVTPMTVANTLTSPTVTPSVVHTTTGVSGVASVQTLTVPTSATGGTFSITGSATTVSSIAYNVSSSDLQAAVQTAYGLGSGVTVTGPSSGVYTITFPAGARTAMTTNSALTGVAAGSTSTASTTTGVLGVSGLVIG